MEANETALTLTRSLEDYLETIYELVTTQKLARVRDIAKRRGVRAGSVSPAMKRLADLGLIEYVQREYIDLTPEGELQARRVLARHQILTRFLSEILKMSPDGAERDACAMEHSLSDEGMDHLTRLFEFLHVCPEGQAFLDALDSCPRLQDDALRCHNHPACPRHEQKAGVRRQERMVMSRLKPGERGVVAQVPGEGAIRQRLLDMGILPDVAFEIQRVAPTGDPIWISLQGFQLSLRRKEAELISVVGDRSPRTG